MASSTFATVGSGPGTASGRNEFAGAALAAVADRPRPALVDLILSSLDAGGSKHANRRAARRFNYRTVAALQLFSDPTGSPPWVLYTRDVNPRSLGFVTPHRLPLGYGGQVELPGPDGSPVAVHCTLLRCREAAPGWFEGSVYFNRDQPVFDLERS